MTFLRSGPSYLVGPRRSSRAATFAKSARVLLLYSRWSVHFGTPPVLASLFFSGADSGPVDRFRQKSEVLTGIVEETFATLVTLGTNLLNSPPPGAEQDIPAILHFILKAYKHSIVLNLSRYQQSAEGLVPWGRLLFQVVNLRIPNDIVPVDEEERERSEWWKAKKWAYGILGRLFHRYVIALTFRT